MSVSGPLTGCRVLELGSIIAGPFCGRLLADFGAEVIKIEPLDGDGLRKSGKRYKGKSLYAASLLRNKNLVSIDLRTVRGQDLIKRLVPKCDVVIENFTPGNLEKWSLGYEDLSRINPGLVMVRISGFGQTGPLSSRPGFGVVAEAMSGLRHITGDPDRPPARVGVAVTDYITGLYGAFGAMMALYDKAISGKGQFVDAALYECAFSFMEPFVPMYEKLGFIASRTGSALADSAPNNLYPTSDGEFVHITANLEGIFKRLAIAIERPELIDNELFSTPLNRAKNAAALDGLISAWTRLHTASDAEEKLAAGRVPVSRIYTMADIFKSEHYRSREMLANVPDDDFGEITLAAPVPKLSRTPGFIRRSGGRVGRDTRDVLERLAGLSLGELEILERERVIFSG